MCLNAVETVRFAFQWLLRAARWTFHVFLNAVIILCLAISVSEVAPRIVLEVSRAFECCKYIAFCIPAVPPRIVLDVSVRSSTF